MDGLYLPGLASPGTLAAVRIPDGRLSIDVELEASGLGAAEVARARERWGLTRAEGNVLGLLVTGYTNADIAGATRQGEGATRSCPNYLMGP